MKQYKVISIIRLMRPQSVLLMLLFVYIPIVMKTADRLYGMRQVLPLYLLLTAEIILNDYMDVEKDIINKPHRPLASGAVNISLAPKLIMVFLGCASVSGCFIYGFGSVRLRLFVVVFLILTLYSLFPRIFAPVKAFVTAFVTFLCLCFIFTYFGMAKVFFYYAIAAFFYISSREMLMDIRDYEGDRQYQCRTIAVRYGKERAYWLAAALMGVSQFLYVSRVLIHSNIWNKLLWGSAAFILLILFVWFKSAPSGMQNKIALLLWLPMLMTIPAVML